jgi:hypothetical protein
LSVLTKVLIVLLSFFSLFLCGMVVTYVSTAENFKVKYNDQKTVNVDLEQQRILQERLFKEQNNLTKDKIAAYEGDLQKLREEIVQLELEKRNAERTSLSHQARADGWQGLVDSFSKTIANMEETLKNTQAQLDKTRQSGIKDQKELSEITASLYEKIVQLEALDAKSRRALEQKQELEDKLTKMASTPADPVTATPVTKEKTNVVSAGPIPSSVDLKGLITELNQSMATLSLGTADGVKKDMVFHVTRGDAFICDIVITSIDVNKSAGVVELKQKEPKVGDTASTKL